MGQVFSVCTSTMRNLFQKLVTSIKYYTSSTSSTSALPNNGVPPLLKPAMEGDLTTIQELIAPFLNKEENQTDDTNQSMKDYVNMSDPAQNTALHGAVFGGHIDVVKFFVEHCHADIVGKNNIGCSPIWLAAGYGHVECFQYLLSQIKLLPLSLSSSDSMDAIVQHVLQDENNTGDSPLIASASRGHTEICDILLQTSMECDDGKSTFEYTKQMLTKENKNGDTPLTVTISNASDENDCIKLTNILLKYDEKIQNRSNGNDIPSKLLNTSNKKGLTPLLIACERNLPLLITLLLETWAAQFLADDQGNSPLGIASFCGNVDAVEAILKTLSTNDEMNSAINKPNDKGCTPLWLACRTGNAKMVKLLLDAGADLSLKNEENISPLEVAEKHKKDDVAEILKERMVGTATD